MLSKEEAQLQVTNYSKNREFYDWLDVDELEEFIESDDGSVCLVQFGLGIGE